MISLPKPFWSLVPKTHFLVLQIHQQLNSVLPSVCRDRLFASVPIEEFSTVPY
jgi:hypothetical protein